jgi:acetoacetyl-CoA synthetase
MRVWTPSPEQVRSARIGSLRDLVNQRYDVELPPGYGALHRWSVEYPGEFWAAVWDLAAVPGSRGERLTADEGEFATTRFLPDARLNVAEALLAGWDHEGTAISFTGEDGESDRLSGTGLRGLVGRLQAALRADGVGPRDVVAAVVSNRPEAYALMIATASIGAVFTSVSPDFGADAVLERFGQVRPVVLVGVARYAYAGREHDVRPVLATVARALPTLRRTILIGGSGDDGGDGGWVGWDDWLAPHPRSEPRFERFGFDHPWYVLYSSGTTGKPKCIVHRAGGLLLKHLAEHRFQHDLGPGDRLCFFTTAGWMMWNWQASALASGAGLVLYDGSPAHPRAGRLFAVAAAEEVTALGVSPRFLAACASAGLRPREESDLSRLRLLLVTGSPLSAELGEYAYQAAIPATAQLAPISGGTDLCGVIVGSEPTSPVHAGQMQCADLGMDADVVDAEGRSLPAGELGELVVRRPFPSMPLGFVADEDGSRYCAAYFERFPGLWHHGDFAGRTAEGGFVITGRSDATLNPGGVRIGTAEIYRQLEAFEEIEEAAAIGYEAGGDSRVALFLQLTPGRVLDEALTSAVRARIRANLSPRHVPAVVVQAPDLPRTRSGKLSELAVREVVHGRPVANTAALANPECLDFFAGLDRKGW